MIFGELRSVQIALSNSGCRDRNECDYGSYAENTHNCVRSSNNGICMNNAGLYFCVPPERASPYSRVLSEKNI